MTEQIILELAKVRALTVISRTSAMQYKGVVRSIPDIARELNVQAVVEGSVTRVGNDVRITAQLIQGATDGHLWAENYNGTLDHVLRFQSEIALAIAKAIQVTLTPEEETRIASVKETDPEAEQERIFDGWLEQRRGLFFKVVRAYAFKPRRSGGSLPGNRDAGLEFRKKISRRLCGHHMDLSGRVVCRHRLVEEREAESRQSPNTRR